MRIYAIVILWLSIFQGFTQNLVPNPSFEEKLKCPSDFVTYYREIYVKNWESPNMGTPDYFNSCAKKCGVPHNWVGSAEAFHGNAYMGIIACMQQYDARQIPYREYIRVELLDTLKAGETYFASMKIRLGESCIATCNGLGMHFSSQKMTSDLKINYQVRSDITFSDNRAPVLKDEWLTICGNYTAKGNETYLFIGNFLSNQKMEYIEFDENFLSTPNTSPMAYFYIDFVQVCKVHPDSVYNCMPAEDSDIVAFEGDLFASSKMVLKNLQFEFDESIILQESYYELDQLAMLLLAAPMTKIALYGHTDNKGDNLYNNTLSENRANAVKNYLIRKGVSPRRITAKGFGSSLPIDKSETDLSRALNRRVEIEVFKN